MPDFTKIIDTLTGFRLNLSECFIKDTDIISLVTSLNKYRKITELNLSHNSISSIGAKELAKLNHICKLDLTCTYIGMEGMQALLDSNISELIFDECDLDDKAASILLEYMDKKSISCSKNSFASSFYDEFSQKAKKPKISPAEMEEDTTITFHI